MCASVNGACRFAGRSARETGFARRAMSVDQ
jgi:hypothetical protein